MKVTQEKLPASQIGLEIEIPGDVTTKAYEQVIQKFTRSANIPGFRKGKVPRQVILQRFGSASLKAAALEDLLDDSLKAAIKQENIQVLGNYQLLTGFEELVGQYEPGQVLKFSASVDVQPEVALKQYKGLAAKAEEIKPDPESVATTLENYRAQVATLVPIEDRGADWKDAAIIDFKGVLASSDDGSPFPGGEATDFQVEMEPGRFIEGFLEGIIGMKPGETQELAIAFPADYPQAELAGEPVTFTVTLKELKAKELPELDDDFAQEVSDFETFQELRESLEKQAAEEAEGKTRDNKEQAILDELIQHLEAELPETLIERELNFMINQTAMQLSQQGLDVRRLFTEDTIAMMKERSREDAIQRIKRTLAMGEVAKQESIEVDEAEISTKADELYQAIGQDRSVEMSRVREVVTEDLLKEKILDWLFANSSIELVPEGSLAPVAAPETELEAAPEIAPETTPDLGTEAETGPEAETDPEPEASPKPAKAKAKAKVAEKQTVEEAAAKPSEKPAQAEPETATKAIPKETSAKGRSSKEAEAKEAEAAADQEAEAQDTEAKAGGAKKATTKKKAEPEAETAPEPSEKKPAKASAKAAVRKTAQKKKAE